jgi:hypothetical protein
LEPQSGTNIALNAWARQLRSVGHGNPDRNGSHRRYPTSFRQTDNNALSKAEERFERLTGQGFTAAVRSASGGVAVTRTFDANAEETLFFPRLVGG